MFETSETKGGNQINKIYIFLFKIAISLNEINFYSIFGSCKVWFFRLSCHCYMYKQH